jgi:D-alanyl-D-alanine dipeptidase
MVELKTIVPNIEYDLRYATVNNFMHLQVYENGSNAFLRLVVARQISKTCH